MVTLLLAFLSVLMTVGGQLLLKTGALRAERLLLNAYVFLGYGLFMATALVNGLLLQRFDLKYFSLIFAGNYLFTNICAVCLFKETVAKSYYAGLACILAGIIIFNI